MKPTFTFYTDGESTWQAMLQALRSASVSIDIEQYIFFPDKIGNEFLDILKERSRSGVKVRLLLDAVGSYPLYNSSVPEELRKVGIEIKFFNPISPWRIPHFTSWFFRDHRKILVVDRRVGFTGGIGVRDYMKTLRDTNARLEGDVVLEMMDSFEETWQILEDKNIFHQLKKLRQGAQMKYFVTNTPYFKKRFLYHAFIDALRDAKKSIDLTTAYFIPDHRLVRVLRLAVRRGVEVRVIVPRKYDIVVAATASQSHFEELLRAGVRIFRYHPAVLHSKTAVVDDAWATFGSFNLDNLSFVYSMEGNVVSTDVECVEELKKHFEEDLRESVEVTLPEWRKRPLHEKVREFFILFVRWFL